MKPEIKKLLILNLPYLLFVYLFDKVGAAVRLSPGMDASQKILHLGEGFTAAFASAAPSFHPADLLIGVAGAVIIRLAVYLKGKNAKKYRKGIEYGSARWGTADHKDIFVSCIFRLLRAAVHGEPFRLCKRDIVLKYRVCVRFYVVGCPPTCGTVLNTFAVFLRVLAF